MSPNSKSATWVCGYCKKKLIVKSGEDRPEAMRAPIPEQVRNEVWRRDGGCCVECGSKEKLEYDHIIPVAKGGSDSARNLQLLCLAYNRQKSNKIG